ncbi:MAG TPA: LemA family protein [Bacteroidia bacterium]|jgi:LemA protein|nr:LemA family protein [Bacteroidia bacterium]
MKQGTIVLLVVVGLALLVIFGIFIGPYNGMVSRSQNTSQMWSNVETQYQRRNDLYSTVMATIKGSAKFEQQTLTDVIEARSKATSITVDASKLTPESVKQFEQAQDGFKSSFGRLMAIAEQYPDLKTTAAFQDFQTQQEGTENRINKARQDFNDVVKDYNTYIMTFPHNIVANMYGFTSKGYFQAQAGTDKVPNVSF